MPIVAETVDAVVGGDTHRDQHVLEMVTASGVVLAQTSVANTEQGFVAALAWIAEQAPGSRVLLALEGTRSYGIGLARAVQAAGWWVVEAERPRRVRGRGKSDALDAHTAALQALRCDVGQLSSPRADGDREALRILLNTRQAINDDKNRSINRLRALLLTSSDEHRSLSRGALGETVLSELAQQHPAGADWHQQVLAEAMATLASHILQLRQQLVRNDEQLAAIVGEMAPALLATHGVGPLTGAQTLVSFSHSGRCRNEAAFAALAGVNPIPASSGNTVRHRLNRGGDRSLNRALHTIALTRWATCRRTRAYITKRRQQGNTNREIQRLLKRYIARELFKTLTPTPGQP